MSFMSPIPFETVCEDEDGEFGRTSGFHLFGHGHTIDDVELFLHSQVEGEYDYDWEAGLREWEVTETWVRKVPCGYGMRYVYASGPGRGATAVTALSEPWGWDRWCTHHLDERACVGIPAGRFIDGETYVARRLEQIATEIDPRRDVDDRNGGTVYYCRPCSNAYSERERAARALAMAAAS
ncbi:hypothetical protein [Cellulomonas rhizosphaerae]|uniref:Uncharacterized protein n=1 Tax=Cellulomonas rhizosphaerae TaxID=2293719 RepID=A0A413RJD6_9CELL|nr:hypothetical protein [Cellulomonas rhizosphaerae]RHA38701.1 hypothetical protein D1825_13280 [Cellulomonas rhizosphaerae]